MNEVERLQAKLNSLHKKEELSSERVELNMINDVKKAKSKAISSAKSASKSINSAISELRNGAIEVGKGLKIVEEAVEKAKDIGADSFIKQGQSIKSEFESILKEYTKSIQSLQESRKIVS